MAQNMAQNTPKNTTKNTLKNTPKNTPKNMSQDTLESIIDIDTLKLSNPKALKTIDFLQIVQKRLHRIKSLPTGRVSSASSLTNSGTGQFITDEINSLRNFQKDQRKKDESIADLEEIRYQKIMALCDEITHGNFDGKIDSGTSSMQTTPAHHNGNHTLPRNRRGSAQNVNQVNSQNTNSSQNTTSIHQNQLHHSLHSNQQQSTQQQSTHPNNHQNISTNFPPFNPEHSLQIELHQLKNKISHIESQLDEAQRNAEIEKKLIQAELKNENQVLAEDEKKLREVNHELNCLKQDFQEKLDNIDNTQEEFLILEQTSIIEDEHETEEARVGTMQVRLEKEIESRKVSWIIRKKGRKKRKKEKKRKRKKKKETRKTRKNTGEIKTAANNVLQHSTLTSTHPSASYVYL